MLHLDGVSKVYVSERDGRGVLALRGLRLRVAENEFVCIIGPSGCGKSSLLHMVAGFEVPSRGTITLAGKEIRGPSPDRGVVFQQAGLLPWKSVLENIEFGLAIQGKSGKVRREIARTCLELVGLRGFDKARPHELSGGMQQKVAIARILALDPAMLLMDEPFGALDEQTRKRLDQELLTIWEQRTKTVLFVTHSIEEAILLADRIVLLTMRPGEVQLDLKIELPRPRDLFSPEVTAIRRQLFGKLMLCCPPDENGI